MSKENEHFSNRNKEVILLSFSDRFSKEIENGRVIETLTMH